MPICPRRPTAQYSALANWKNDANNFGVMVQLFSETRHLRRDGVEILGYETIAPGSALPRWIRISPACSTRSKSVRRSSLQERQRNGGMADLEFKPADNVTLDLSGFHSKLDCDATTNRNYLLWPTNFVNGATGQSPDAGYVVENNTLISASFAPVAGTVYGVYDQISRPDESATANFVDLDGTWNATDNFSLFAQVGYSWGDGKTPTQNVSETDPGTGTGGAIH